MYTYKSESFPNVFYLLNINLESNETLGHKEIFQYNFRKYMESSRLPHTLTVHLSYLIISSQRLHYYNNMCSKYRNIMDIVENSVNYSCVVLRIPKQKKELS